MQKNQVYKTLCDLSKYHYYRLPAKAKYLTVVENIQEILDSIEFAALKNVPFVIIGKGSNIIFKDDYYCGLVIINKLCSIEFDGEDVLVMSGVSTQYLARKTAKQDLGGLQGFIGIPGTVGGAVFMNAGAAGFETAEYLEYVDVWHNGKEKRLTKEQCMFSYRKSIFQNDAYIILQAKFKLYKDENAKESILENQRNRLLTQPIEMKNSGCIFKNPSSTISAGKLIDQCGLKGIEYKGLQVSIKHANFINNISCKSAKDVEAFISYIAKKVKEKKEVDLEHEIRII